MASYANKARNSDQVTKEQGDQSRTLNAAIASDRHGQREMAKRATLVDWAHAYADKCTVHGPRQLQYVHFGKEATDRTEADEWTKVMETIVPPEYPPEIRDQIDSKFVTRKGESGDHHTGIFGKARQPLGNSNSYPNRSRCDAMVHDGTRLGMVASRNGEVIPLDDAFWTAEYMNAYDLNSQLSAVRAGVPARSGAEEGERRGRTKGFYTQKDPFTGEDAGLAVPELLRPHHGMPLVPWAAEAAMTRAMMTTKNGNFLRACLGPLVRPMSCDPTEMTIDQGPRLGLARIVAALRVRRRVEGDTDLVKVDARILARPDKGMIVAGIPAEADAMIADLLHTVRSPPRGAVRGEMSAADVMAPPMTVAIATETGAGMTDVTNQIPLRLADPRLATAVEMVGSPSGRRRRPR